MRTYCNPLSLPASASRSLADPALVAHEGRWYLFVSWDQAWVSDDLARWEYRPVHFPVEVIGPAIVEYDGWFYLSANNGIGMWRARHPLGPWEHLGEIKDHRGEKIWWADLMFFVDDDRTFYCYHHSGSGVGSDGVFVTPLDPAANFTRALAPTRNCFAHVPSHEWERWGERNEHRDVAWIEASWMTKRRGKYYLQYSGAGTEWTTYAVGLYTADSPTGPFWYDERSPLLKSRGGLLQGPGHHALIAGPNGTVWNFYHVLLRNTDKFDRRLAMDPVGFDEQGRMLLPGPSETPQLVPGAKSDPERGNDAGMLALSIHKEATASSAAPGRDASYAVDNYVRTWWRAADVGLPQWLEVNLEGEFTIEACRIILCEQGRKRDPAKPDGCRFRLEISSDGKAWSAAHEHADARDDRDIHYLELTPTRGRRVRLTITGMPEGIPAGVVELTVFGRS